MKNEQPGRQARRALRQVSFGHNYHHHHHRLATIVICCLLINPCTPTDHPQLPELWSRHRQPPPDWPLVHHTQNCHDNRQLPARHDHFHGRHSHHLQFHTLLVNRNSYANAANHQLDDQSLRNVAQSLLDVDLDSPHDDLHELDVNYRQNRFHHRQQRNRNFFANQQFVVHQPPQTINSQYLLVDNQTLVDTIGKHETFNAADIDECLDERACGRGAVCENLPGSYRCACPAGFTGDPSLECIGKWTRAQ